MNKRLFGSLMLFFCCMMTWHKAGAQFLNPTGYTDTYPTGTNNLFANSCRGMNNVPFNTGTFDLYVSGWSNFAGSGKIIWRQFFVGSNTPVPAGANEIPVNGNNIEVGITVYNGNVFINAAYYKNGTGLVFERFIWTGSNFVLFASTTLSTAITLPYRNINMDMYASSELAVVWSEPAVPGNPAPIVKCVLGSGLNLTSVITLTNTEGGQHPDVALSKNTGGAGIAAMAVHIAYTKDYPNGGSSYREIIEIALPFETAYSSNPNPYDFDPIVEDVNNIGYSETSSYPVIDCPDLCNFSLLADWAYTYASDNGVEMRLINAAAGVTPTTKNLVNGSDYGNMDIYMPFGFYANNNPTLAYSNTGETIHVGWMFNGYPNVNLSSLLSVEISGDGSTLVSAPDYLRISLNSSAVYPQFSKNSVYSYYLYATFLENSAALRHMFHVWGNTSSFRGVSSTAENVLTDRITVAPNPFYNEVHFIVPAVLTDADIAVTMTDVTGKNLYTGSCKGGALEKALQARFSQLAAGTYMLQLHNAALHYEQLQKLIKTE